MIITLLLYWLAHSYADLAGERLRSGARLTARGLLATMLRELPILVGASITLGTLLICWIAGTGLAAAVLAAVWTSAGIVLAIELAARTPPDYAAASGGGSSSPRHSSARCSDR